jgi:hypothetical protein
VQKLIPSTNAYDLTFTPVILFPEKCTFFTSFPEFPPNLLDLVP